MLPYPSYLHRIWELREILSVSENHLQHSFGLEGKSHSLRVRMTLYVCIGGVGVGSNQHLLTWCLWCLSMCWKATLTRKNCDHTHTQTQQLSEGRSWENLSKISLVLISLRLRLFVSPIHVHISDTEQLTVSPHVPLYVCLSACSPLEQINFSIFSRACDSHENVKHRVAIGSASSAVSRASSSHMITVLTALHDLIHLSPFSAQRQKVKKAVVNKGTEKKRRLR